MYDLLLVTIIYQVSYHFANLFANRQLERHMLVHTHDRPFICPQCGDGFTQRASLQRHQAAMHALE